jgi:hypothetical protein
MAAVVWQLPWSAAAQEAGVAEKRKLVLDVDFGLANVNDDSLRRSLGRERAMKVPYALVGLGGELGPYLSFRIELNGVDDTRTAEPFSASAQMPFFFPNTADPGYGVYPVPDGQVKVDDYKQTGLDPYLQQQHMREAYLDVHTKGGSVGLIAGRFIVPIGLDLDSVRWFTAKDLPHIESIDALADAGLQAYWRFGREDAFHGRLSAAGITGNGNPYHDYAYSDFTSPATTDTNSAIGGVVTLRLSPLTGLTFNASGEYNFVGSRIEADTTLERSKHYDNKMVVGVSYRPRGQRYVQLFGEAARYKWGLRDTSAELLAGPPVKTPIFKNGYYVGADLGVPLPGHRGVIGVVVTREELSRDDALIAMLAARRQLGVSLGKKERSTIVKGYLGLGPVTAYMFYNFLDNPFPQVSAIVPISGPNAFEHRGSTKIGIGFRLRASRGLI